MSFRAWFREKREKRNKDRYRKRNDAFTTAAPPVPTPVLSTEHKPATQTTLADVSTIEISAGPANPTSEHAESRTTTDTLATPGADLTLQLHAQPEADNADFGPADSSVPTPSNITDLNLREELWNKAYEELKSKEGEVVEAYEKLLTTKLDNINALPNKATRNLINERTDGRWEQMQQLVTAGLKKTERDAEIHRKISDGVRIMSPLKPLIEEAVKACPGGAIAWAGVSFALEILGNPLTESASNREGILYVLSRMEWYWNLVDLVQFEDTSLSPSKREQSRRVLENSITELYQQVLLYQMMSICRYYRSRFIVFFRDMAKLDDWCGQLSDLKDAEAAIDKESETLTSQEVLGRLKKMSDAATRVSTELQEQTSQLVFRMNLISENESNRKCLQALRGTDPAVDLERIKEDKGGLLDDSYLWITKNADFQRWQMDTTVRRLHIEGDAGKGKTMLLCGIIKELEKDQFTRLCYFFCQAPDPTLNTGVAVLRGLMFHLVRRYPRLLAHVREEYDSAGPLLFQDKNAWHAMKKIFKAMLNDEWLDGVCVIVDALDECVGQEDRSRLLDFIKEASNDTGSRAKWLLSSRMWPEITNRLCSNQPNTHLCLPLSDELISDAVQQFIIHKVGELARTKAYMKEQDTYNRVKKHLELHSGHTFLWVSLVCRALARDRVTRPHHVQKVLDESPAGLDELYERIIDNVSRAPDSDACQQILAISSVAQRPLSLQELEPLLDLDYWSEYALSAKMQELHNLIGYCGSFLHVRDERIYFVHQSAQEFLLSDKQGRPSFGLVFPCGITGRHLAIFSKSLQALSQTLHRDIYKLQSPGVLLEDISTPSPDPLAPLRYCCVYWVGHLCESVNGDDAGGLGCLQDNGIVHEFLKTKFLYWVEALTLLGKLSQGISAVQTVREMIVRTYKSISSFPPEGLWHCAQQMTNSGTMVQVPTAGNEARQLADFVQDANRFLLYHRAGIEQAPLQIYASALVFSPEGSTIRKLFQEHAPDWIVESPIMKPTWDMCRLTLEGLEHNICWTAFSSDGRWLARADMGGLVIIWEAATGACVQALYFNADLYPEYIGPIAVRFTADGCRLQAAWGCGIYDPTGPSFSMGIWDLATGNRLHTSSYKHMLEEFNPAKNDSLKELAITSGTCNVTVASVWLKSQEVVMWDATVEGKRTHTLRGHDDHIHDLAFSPNDRWLATNSRDWTVRIWDSASGECVRILTHSLQSQMSPAASDPWPYYILAFSWDRHWLVLGSNWSSAAYEVWNTRTGERRTKLEEYAPDCTSAAFSEDNRLLALCGSDKTAIFDVDNGTLLRTLPGTGASLPVLPMAFSPDGQSLASASNDGVVRVWDVSSSAHEYTDETRCVSNFKGATFSADGRLFATSTGPDFEKTGSSTIKVGESFTGKCLQILPSAAMKMCFTADSSRLASVHAEEWISVWDIKTGRREALIPVKWSEEKPSFVVDLAITTDGSQVTCSTLNEIRIWKMANGERAKSRYMLTCTIAFNALKLPTFVASICGKWLAYCGEEIRAPKIRIRNLVDDDQGHSLGGHIGPIDAMAFSADSQWLATASNNEIKIWNTATRTCLQTTCIHDEPRRIPGSSSRIPYITFSGNDCTRLYTPFGYLDLDLNPTRSELLASETKTACLRSYGVHGDGRWVVRDGVKLLWIPRDHRPNYSPRQWYNMCHVCLIGNGSFLAWASRLGKIYRMEVSPHDSAV